MAGGRPGTIVDAGAGSRNRTLLIVAATLSPSKAVRPVRSR